MLTQEDDVEVHVLYARGWSVSAIARHAGRDRKMIAKYLKGDGPGQHRQPAPSCLESFRDYIAARFVDDPHLPRAAVTLLDALALQLWTGARFTLHKTFRLGKLRSMSLREAASLPMTPDELSPAWLSDALVTAIDGVRVDDVIWGTATKVFLELEHTRDLDELPRAVCVKGGFDDRLRGIGATNDAYRIEARFFGEIAPGLSVALPRTFYCGVVPDVAQGVVVMEDLRATGARFGDPCEPFSPDEVAAGLEVQAGWHAATWGTAQSLAPWLSVGSPSVRGAARVLLGPDFWAYYHAQDESPALSPTLDDRERLLKAFETLWTYEDAQTGCLSHGDAHIGNTYQRPGEPVAFLDWQGVCIAPWSYDVAYFIGGALSVAYRREHERHLLEHYRSALEAAGGPALTFDSCWEAYRRHTLHGFLWAMTPPVMQPVERVQAMAERHIAAIEDHETLALLGV